MLYQSTRGKSPAVSSARAVLNGIAPDGGLYMPELNAAQVDYKRLLPMTAMQMAEEIFRALLPGFEDISGIVHRAYTGKFETDELTPLVPVGDRFVLELFRGPTSAFKDVALSALPQFISQARKQEGLSEKVVILTATSGDTGKAALEGFHDVAGTQIIVFYPDGGVSAVQRAQMVTQEGANVRVCAVRGNFDDAQTGVKKIFANADRKLLSEMGVTLSSANSINIGRLVPQVVYYYKAYADLCRMGRIQPGEKVDFTVPTGNFGDILAGYFAKCLGLPVGKLICASNANDVLTDFLHTGRYDRRRPFYKTISPSMDILVSSNLERLLYLLSGCDADFVAEKMAELEQNGFYQVPQEMVARLHEEFSAETADDALTTETIGKVWREHRYLCDTHTAVAWYASEKCGGSAPNVVLSTASPYKFPAAVCRALGALPDSDEFAVMEQLRALTGVPIPKNLAGLSARKELHRSVVDKEKMMDYVLDAIREGKE